MSFSICISTDNPFLSSIVQLSCLVCDHKLLFFFFFGWRGHRLITLCCSFMCFFSVNRQQGSLPSAHCYSTSFDSFTSVMISRFSTFCDPENCSFYFHTWHQQLVLKFHFEIPVFCLIFPGYAILLGHPDFNYGSKTFASLYPFFNRSTKIIKRKNK